MSSKSLLGQTKKYSNIVKGVKNTQPKQEEPLITREQVMAAFHSFGFEPNERNHNDIGYWTMKPISEAPKLMEELHKRRIDINNKEDEDNKTVEEKKKKEEDIVNQRKESTVTLPRLSDEEINALFDEYGLPAPDPEWVRSHLPNDPKKIRSILELQRKTADDMLKKHSKNTVNSIPEIPKNIPMNAQPMQNNGMGGPMPLDMQGGMAGEDSKISPFFIGDNSIVRITNQNNPNVSTLWLVDAKKKVLRPFLSEKAFENAFEDLQEAQKAIVTISTRELGPGGALDGFKPLQGIKGVNEDGSMDKIDFSPAQIQKRYGKAQDPEKENKAVLMLDGVLGKLNKSKK